MSQISNFVQNANPITLTAGENIAQGDLVSAYSNGKAYYATSANSGLQSYDPVTGYLRPFFSSSIGGTTASSLGFTGSPYFTTANNVPVINVKAVALSNGNIAIMWGDNNLNGMWYCVLTPTGAIVVGNTTLGFSSNASFDICATPGGGFAITWANNGASTYYIRTFDNAGNILLSTSRSAYWGAIYQIRIAPIGTTGFLLAACGQSGAQSEIVPMDTAGTFGSGVTTYYYANQSANGGWAFHTSNLMVLSNGNFALVAAGYYGASYPYFYLFSATTSSVTTITQSNLGYNGSYGAMVQAIPDNSGGFFVGQACSYQYAGGYNYLFYVNSSGGVYGGNSFGNGRTPNIGNFAFAVSGNTIYTAISGYQAYDVYFERFTWNGSNFTQNASYSLSASTYTNYVYVYYAVAGSSVNCFYCSNSSYTYGSITLSGNKIYNLAINPATMTVTGATALVSTNGAPFIFSNLGNFSYPNGDAIYANAAIAINANSSSVGNLLSISAPAENIVPYGVAVAAATANNPVTVQTGGNITTRLTFPLGSVNASRNIPAGNTITLASNTAEMFGIAAAPARPIN